MDFGGHWELVGEWWSTLVTEFKATRKPPGLVSYSISKNVRALLLPIPLYFQRFRKVNISKVIGTKSLPFTDIPTLILNCILLTYLI